MKRNEGHLVLDIARTVLEVALNLTISALKIQAPVFYQ